MHHVINTRIKELSLVLEQVLVECSKSIEEIALLINLIKQSTFQGENIESLYNLVLKLQNQYLSLDK